MNVNNKITKVHLTSKIGQLLVAVLSVTFGISMYVFLNSFMSGVNEAQTQIMFTSLSHIRVYNDTPTEIPLLITPKDTNTLVIVSNNRNIRYSEGIKNAQPIITQIEQLKDVTCVTEQINQNVFVRNGVTKFNMNLSGIDVENENRLFDISKYMVDGSYFDLQKRTDGIILGNRMAQNLGVKVGDNVSIMTSDNVTRQFKVIGIFATGSIGTDKTKAMINIHTARQLFSKNRNYATDILINIKDYKKAQKVAGKISNITPYKVEAWQDGNSQLDSASFIRDLLALAVSFTILIVAGFGIYNIMNMTVNEKVREIAILKAMGFNGNDIVNIFLSQSVTIGLVGGFTGLGLGYLISKIVNNIPFKIATFNTLPISFNWSDYIMAFSFGLIITILAGYVPARKASKVDPVAILRG